MNSLDTETDKQEASPRQHSECCDSERDACKGESRLRAGSGGGLEGLQWASQRTEDANTERGLEGEWADLGGQVGKQDHGQRHKGMLGSGLFKLFNMAGIWGVLEEKEVKI